MRVLADMLYFDGEKRENTEKIFEFFENMTCFGTSGKLLPPSAFHAIP
jgi:hypothetical protein